ncbi:MAG: hypothetical protein QM753_13600 [Thermomicrobiales bacterium]
MAALRKPSSPVVQLSPQTHAKLLAFSKDEARPMGEIVADLVDRYEREQFWLSVRAAYARLRDDPAAWQAYLDEVDAWDTVASDVLQGEPYYSPEEEREILAQSAARRAQGG